MEYVIKSLDGVIARKTATRPYTQAIIYRDKETNEISWVDKMTTIEKNIIGSVVKEYYSTYENRFLVGRWEQVIPSEKKARVKKND